MQYNFTENYSGDKAVVGDKVSLQALKDLDVVACQETGVPMLNIDADQIKPGDLTFIKNLGLTISNPDTDKPVALGADFKENTWGHRLAHFFTPSESSTDEDKSDEDDDDDSGFFSSGSFLGGMGSGGFGGFSGGGGFGGFGGGSFSGGGASGGF